METDSQNPSSENPIKVKNVEEDPNVEDNPNVEEDPMEETQVSNGINLTADEKSVLEDDDSLLRNNPIDDMNLENCPVCQKEFTSPKILHCLHPICKGCVKQIEMPLGNGKPKLQCPLKSCSEFMKVDRHMSFTLSDNTYVESQTLGHPAKAIMCSLCRQKEQTVLAMQRCMDCSAQLCDDCAVEHTKSHDVKTYASLVEEDKESIVKQLEELEKKGDELNVKEEVDARRLELQEQEEKDLAQMDKDVEKMMKTIQEEKEKAVTLLKEFYSKQKAKCETKAVSCQQLKDAITSTVYFTQKVLNMGTSADLFHMRKAFDQRIKSLMPRKPRPNLNMTCPKVKTIDSHSLFKDKLLFKVMPPILIAEQNASGSKNKNGGQDGPRMKKQKTFKEKQNQRIMIGHVIASQGSMALRPIQKFSAALPSDNLVPDLVGIALTPDGGLALVDRTNNCVKLFNPGGHFKESFSAHRPESIAVFEDIIAWSNQQSLFFNSKGRGCVYKMDFTTVGGRYPLAAFMDSYVLVGNLFQRYLRTMDAQGMRVQQIDQKAVSGKVLGNVLYISGNRKGTYILSDLDSRKITFTKTSGKPFAQFPPAGDASKNFEPHGVCCEKRGNVFVADNKGDRIFLLNSYGTEIQQWPIHGLINRPKAIACSSEQDGGYLFVTSDDGHVNVIEYLFKG